MYLLLKEDKKEVKKESKKKENKVVKINKLKVQKLQKEIIHKQHQKQLKLNNKVHKVIQNKKHKLIKMNPLNKKGSKNHPKIDNNLIINLKKIKVIFKYYFFNIYIVINKLITHNNLLFS